MNQTDWLTTDHVGAMLRHLTHEVHRAEDAIGDHRRQAPLISQRQVSLFEEACFARFGLNADDVGVQKPPAIGAAALLREIVGNPFRPVTLPLRRKTEKVGPWLIDGHTVDEVFTDETYCPWLTPDVLALAHAAHDERPPDGSLDPVRLAVLADALEDAGCDDVYLIGHLRGTEDVPCVSGDAMRAVVRVPLRGPHVRGCWAIDLLTGRAGR